MKTKTIFLILCALISINALSQIKLGVRVGLTSSTIKAGDYTTSNGVHVQTLSNAKIGFQGGLMLRIKIAKLIIQPEALLSSTSGEVRVSDVTTTTVTKQRFTKLDVPVLIGTKLGPIRLGIGPVASVILNKPSEAIDFSGTSIENKYHKATFGYQVGAGIDLGKKIAIDLKYEGNLSKLGNGVVIGGNNYKFDSRTHQWILGIGIFF
jgi:opacity protein-like surface antigen